MKSAVLLDTISKLADEEMAIHEITQQTNLSRDFYMALKHSAQMRRKYFDDLEYFKRLLRE